MRKNVYVSGDHIITSLGFSTGEVALAIGEGRHGFRMVSDRMLTPAPLPLSLIDTVRLEAMFREVLLQRHPEQKASEFTRLEKILIVSVHQTLTSVGDSYLDERTLPVLSTTKGNIDLLETRFDGLFDPKRRLLGELASVIRHFFGFRNPILIVSNACISGVLALSLAARQLENGRYDRAVVMGGDILSEFVISGFISFQALSPEPCKPFDAARNGLSLGEGCGTITLTTEKTITPVIRIAGSASTNDANHISGPSRTGEELALAIRNAMKEADIRPDELDFVAAHGTATVFNDEMESKSLAIAGCSHVPVNSFKGYWGHTLGGAGILESALTIHSMLENQLFRSEGFSDPGVPEPVNVIREHRQQPVRNSLKTASGFGGCNAAIVFRKED